MASHERPLVLHVITGLGVGGAERALARLVALSTQFRHEVIVLAHAGPIAREITQHGSAVTSLNATKSLGGLFRLSRLRELLRARQPAIVQSWLVHSNVVAALATPREIPLVWNVRHTLDSFERERRSTRIALRASTRASQRPAAIIYNSGRAAEQHEAIGYPESSRVIIFNGFAIEGDAASRREGVRRALGISATDIAIGLVARVHPIKNHEGFLIAGRRLVDAFPSARFVLVGAGTAPQGELAKRYAGQFGSRAIWLGERCDIPSITQALDIACNVSHGEAFSNTLGEAMAAGIPCVATDVGESANILGDTGWLACGRAPEDIERALREALRVDSLERARRGAAARARIEEMFSSEATADRYEQVYDCALRHHKPRALNGNGMIQCAE